MEVDLQMEFVMRIFIMMILGAFFSVVMANNIVGSVESLKGRVKVKSENSIKKSRVKAGLEIKAGDLIITSKNAFAKIKLKDDSTIVLDESSSILFNSVYDAKQDSGKIYYKITSRDAKNSLKIKTPFAIIGIKGTTFIINTSKENSFVSLKEGLIGVASVKEKFELYRTEVRKQFEDFMAQQQASYEEYKQVQKPGFVEKTKEFDLKANKIVSFDGNKASEKDWTNTQIQEFKHFQDLMDLMK